MLWSRSKSSIWNSAKKEWEAGFSIDIITDGFTGIFFLKKRFTYLLISCFLSDKLVTLTTHNNEKARIVGITRDYGMLEAVNIDDSRKRYTLQPDGNSFDMLKGLIIKKE